MALIAVVLAVIVILGAVTVVFNRVNTAKMRTDSAVDATRLDEALKAGVDIAVERIWHQYLIGNGNTTGNLASYRVFVDGLVANNEDLNGNGSQDTGETGTNGNGVFDMNPAGVDIVKTADSVRSARASESIAST